VKRVIHSNLVGMSLILPHQDFSTAICIAFHDYKHSPTEFSLRYGVHGFGNKGMSCCKEQNGLFTHLPHGTIALVANQVGSLR
jgi:hypothetical protein